MHFHLVYIYPLSLNFIPLLDSVDNKAESVAVAARYNFYVALLCSFVFYNYTLSIHTSKQFY